MDKPMRLVIGMILLWMLVHEHLAHGRETPVDLIQMRDVICWYETSGLRDEGLDPNKAIGRAQELGMCQILPTTAVQYGCDAFRLDEELHSMDCALRILLACKSKTVQGIATCYNPGSKTYGKIRASQYAEWDRRAQWFGHRKITLAMEE